MSMSEEQKRQRQMLLDYHMSEIEKHQKAIMKLNGLESMPRDGFDERHRHHEVKMSDCPSELGAVCKDVNCPVHYRRY